MKDQLCKLWRSILGLFNTGANFDIAGTFHIIFGVIEHLRPVVPVVDDFVGEGVSSCVVPTVVVDFLDHSPSFVWPETSQIWVGVEAGIRFHV